MAEKLTRRPEYRIASRQGLIAFTQGDARLLGTMRDWRALAGEEVHRESGMTLNVNLRRRATVFMVVDDRR
jgi:hypothetical protein